MVAPQVPLSPLAVEELTENFEGEMQSVQSFEGKSSGKSSGSGSKGILANKTKSCQIERHTTLGGTPVTNVANVG